MSSDCITIRDRQTEIVLASAKINQGTQLFEGAWYFDRDTVDMTHLVVTNRTYICPYKGVCYWIDLDAPDHKGQNVAFTYFDVKPGYEFIQDKIAFFAGSREHTVEK
jgi:uncharacterized protein (DUF427 family)